MEFKNHNFSDCKNQTFDIHITFLDFLTLGPSPLVPAEISVFKLSSITQLEEFSSKSSHGQCHSARQIFQFTLFSDESESRTKSKDVQESGF